MIVLVMDEVTALRVNGTYGKSRLEAVDIGNGQFILPERVLEDSDFAPAHETLNACERMEYVPEVPPGE